MIGKDEFMRRMEQLQAAALRRQLRAQWQPQWGLLARRPPLVLGQQQPLSLRRSGN